MPIGSFQSAWEDYDHTSGPALVTEGKNPLKLGADAPNWRLVIGTEDFTRRVVSAEVTFSRTGESGIRFAAAGNLRAVGYERARVDFHFGYGTKLVPYFRGRLAEPIDYPSGLRSEASAYGLGTQLGQRYLQGRVDYGGWDLRAAWADLMDRFGADIDRFDFQGVHSTTLAPDIGEFGLEHSLAEVEATILEPMQFIAYDQAGGMRVVQRSHLATLGTDEVFSGAGHYDPGDYPKDGFTFEQSMANFYADVVVFRRTSDYQSGGGEPGADGPTGANENDEYAVYAARPVADPGTFHVHEGRDYVIADYPGEQEHAEREAELLATAFSRGVGTFEWKCHPIDFAIGDHLTVTRHEQFHDPLYVGSRSHFAQSRIDAVSYACVVEEITFTLGEAGQEERWTMTVSGQAFEKERETIRAAGSAVAIDLGVAPDPDPDAGQVDGNQVTTTAGDHIVTSTGDRVVV